MQRRRTVTKDSIPTVVINLGNHNCPETSKLEDAQFRQFYEKNWRKVVGIAEYGGVEDPESFAQDMFLDFWKKKGRGRTKLEKYFPNRVRSRVKSAYRAQCRRTEKHNQNRDECHGIEGSEIPMADERIPEVKRAMGRLNPIDRLIVRFRYVEGYYYAEIARSLGLSEGAVRCRASRAIRKLRSLLK